MQRSARNLGGPLEPMVDHAHAIVLIAICTCLLFSSSSSSTLSISKAADNRAWGISVAGLQMSISGLTSNDSKVPEFQVALRNVGHQDIAVSLGVMLANGNSKFPKKITLDLTDSNGTTRKLRYSKPAFIAGRLDDYVVLLRPIDHISSQAAVREGDRTMTFPDDSIVTLASGPIYSFRIRLSDFWSPDTKEFQVALSKGKYQVTAQLEGDGPTLHSSWSSNIASMKSWKGQLQSNTLEIER